MSIRYFSAANNASSISASINSIPMLTGANFKEWKENAMIILGVIDLDLAFQTDKPKITDTSSKDDKL